MKKNIGMIETLDGIEWQWKNEDDIEEANVENIFYNESVFEVPQICGMKDTDKQDRLNKLLIEESQERLYLSSADVKLYIEYISEKYLSYCYQEVLLQEPYHADRILQIYITIDLEEEKRIMLGDVVHLEDEDFIDNFVTYCVGNGEEKEFFREKLQTADVKFGDYMKNGKSGSPTGYLLNYSFFYFRSGKLLLAWHEYDGFDLTMELPVFEDYIKVEPWY